MHPFEWLRIMAFSLAVFGQQAVNSATVSGIVQDQSGGVIAEAQVTVTNVERNQTTNTKTDESGRFRFAYLPVGTYQLRVERLGFAATSATLTLSVGQAVEVPIKLAVAGIATDLSVESEVPSIEIARTQVATTIATKEIDALPINGRNYLDLALLVSAVSRTNTGNNERFAETSAVPGTGISVAGQRNLGNSFVVDGLSANDDAADLAGNFYSQEVIREFEVITSGGIAEFGRASSGIINVVTQSGTNEWHGKFYGFLRNQRFDARNSFAVARTPLTQAQYGMTLSGPLSRDRAFLFSNFEREDLNRSGFIAISPVNVSAINAVLDRVGYGPSRVVTGEYPTGDDRSNFFSKVDFKWNERNRLALRYNLYDISSPNARNVGALNSISRGTAVKDRDHTIGLTELNTISAHSFDETRFQFTRSRLSAPGNDIAGPAVNISGIANFGASTSSPTARDIDLFEVVNNFSTQKARHFLKTGADVLYNRVSIDFPATLYGTYSFSSLANFQGGTYTAFGQAFGQINWFQTNPNLGWFVQDEWRVGRKVTINAGLRHDVQWLAGGIQTRWGNFAPRVGVAWAPGNNKTVLRAGFGQYYDRIPLRAVANALRGAGTEYKSVTLQRTQTGAPSFPNKLAAFPSGTLFNLATIDGHIENAYGLQANVELERDLSRGTTLSGGYLYLRGVHVIMQRNLNVPVLTAAQDPINLGRPNSSFGNITQYSGQGDSYYHGLIVSMQYRGASRASARVSYTLSKAIDNTGNAFFSSPQNNFNIRDDRGLSDNDQRHRLALSGQMRVANFTLSSIFTYGSRYPFNIITGGQTLQTTTARPAGVGRNTGAGFNFSSLDFRLTRALRSKDRIRAEIVAETFNTLNRTNFQFPNNTVGPFLGQATAAADPRQVQFGLKLLF